MNAQTAFAWQFGGWSGVPAALGWTLIVAVAVAGVALAAWLYRDTLQKLTPRQRAIFIALRAGFFLALLICLAGPSRVERTFASADETRPLAVVVDRSASMTTADSAGLSRLTAAVRTWKESEAAALHAFPSVRYFRFSDRLDPAADLQQAVEAPDPGPSTALYASLDRVLEEAPAGGYGGIVCLTDGLDTTQASSDALATRAIQGRTPLHFVVGENHQAVQESLIVRETVTPEKVLRKTQFNATALVEARAARPHDVPLALTQDGQLLASTTLHLSAGLNLLPWSVPVPAGEPGQIHLQWQLGDGAEQETIGATVPVVARSQVNVLFYQGTLDWGFRFINTALQRDASFTVTGLFNPDLDLDPSVGATPPPGAAPGAPPLTALPDNAAAYAPYQIVVLANAFADQLSAAQQQALSDYVAHGGGLLFLVSDTKMAQTFSGTALEAMLPVVFDPPPPGDNGDDSLAEFQSMMQRIGGSNYGSETDFAADAASQPPPPPLTSFALPAQTTRKAIAQLFGQGSGGGPAEVPMFASYAHVAALKAGAEALAVHPSDRTPSNQARALLVAQRYGQGQVTALLTDALWRWKLSVPSTSHAPETFWQQLFLALAGPGGTMHFSRQPYFAALGEQADFTLAGASGLSGPVVTAIPPAPPGGPAPAPKTLTPHAGGQAGEWTFQLTADQAGKWRVQAGDAAGAQIETLLRVGGASHNAELSGLPPDADGLRKLAELTGGAILNDGTPDGWSGRAATPDLTLVSEHVRPLWDTWAVLLLALALYAIELVWRRRAKLL
ncbi:MAG: hypothetical protein WDO13_05730 [Verrucomicrobiota bacterium]